MRFKEYTEGKYNSDLTHNLADGDAEILDLIRNDCAPFLKYGRIFYRGADFHAPEDLIKKSVRSDRKPRDIPIELHDVLDNAFKRKFGWAVRSSGVFATQDWEHATEFGIDTYMFFPIGNFKYVWSGAFHDLFGSLETSFGDDLRAAFADWDTMPEWETLYRNLDITKKPTQNLKEIQKEVGDFIVSRYTDKYLASSEKSEVTFKCNEYYLLGNKFRTIIEKELGLSRFKG